MKPNVFVTRKIPEEGLRIIKENCDMRIWSSEIPPNKQEIIDQAQDCEGLVTLLSDPIDADLIENLPRLRIIAQYAVGYDNIDVRKATERGIIVTNTPGVLTETTADLAWSLMMTVSRRILEADRYVREGHWRVAWGPQMLLGRDIYGATIGIVGMGRIGYAMAKRAAGFSMRILYTSRSETELTKQAERLFNAERVTLDELLEESDFVTLHVPLSSQTKGLIDESRLKSMKRTAVLINTARGPVVEEQALIRALEEGWIRGAGLDVFTNEPIEQDNPLMNLSNVVLAPHIGSASVETRTRMAIMCAENLVTGLRGKRPTNVINTEVLR